VTGINVTPSLRLTPNYLNAAMLAWLLVNPFVIRLIAAQPNPDLPNVAPRPVLLLRCQKLAGASEHARMRHTAIGDFDPPLCASRGAA
jgi:hypothetical protein